MEEHQEHSLGGRVFQRIREDILKGKYKQSQQNSGQRSTSSVGTGGTGFNRAEQRSLC